MDSLSCHGHVCYLPPGRFDAQQKARIADAISQRHSQATGAHPYFVQVQIEETRADRYLTGQLTQNHIWIRGDIRAGRAPEVRSSMMLNIMRRDRRRISDFRTVVGARLICEHNIWSQAVHAALLRSTHAAK
jgi:phenylpyruvate tautomerase PptA (4-oxalocrotonate tautomerase family)